MVFESFVPLIALFGLFAGIFLAIISPEEMKPGKKYFLIFRIAVLTLIALLLVYFGRNYPLLMLVGFFIGFFLRLTYFYFGIALAASFLAGRTELFLLGSLIFLYGFPYGTLLHSETLLNPKKVIRITLLFSAPFLFLFIPSLTSVPIFALTAGLVLGCMHDFRNIY